jgi:hypothetical protein
MIAVACAGSGAKGMSLPRKKTIMAWNAIRVGCGECSHILLPVIPLVDWPQDRRLEKAPIPDAFRSTEYRQLLGMHVDNFVDIEPDRLAHFASAANVSRYSCMILRAISMVRACLGLNGERRKLPSGCSTG